jgi:hypothetical protein
LKVGKIKPSKLTPEHQLLERLINEAGKQLDVSRPDIDAVASVFDGYSPNANAEPLVAAASLVKDGKFPKLPRGRPLPGFPRLSKATGGLFGLWTVAGEPGIGKSTFINQVIYHWLKEHPCLKYDYEMPAGTVLAQMFVAAKAVDREKRLLRRLKNLYFRTDISSLEMDLVAVPPPAMVVIDSVQSLPTTVKHEIGSYKKWLLRFERLAKEGYFVVLVSEKPRSLYGAVDLAGFKGTGDIEYKSWVGIQLAADTEDRGAPIELHIVKNRYRPDKGHVCDLRRSEKRVFWFEEAGAGKGEDLD